MELNLRLSHGPAEGSKVTWELGKPAPIAASLVASEDPFVGMRFRIDRAGADPELSVSARRDRHRHQGCRRSARILIVDDEPAAAEAVRDYLSFAKTRPADKGLILWL